jgi:hypothetical protein
MGSESLPEISLLEGWCGVNGVFFDRFSPDKVGKASGSAERCLTAWLGNFPYAERVGPGEE